MVPWYGPLPSKESEVWAPTFQVVRVYKDPEVGAHTWASGDLRRHGPEPIFAVRRPRASLAQKAERPSGEVDSQELTEVRTT